MRKLALLTAAAFAVVAFGVAPAAAQDTTRKDTTRKEAKGEVATPPTAASIALALDASLATVGKIATVMPDTKIEVVDVGALVANKPAEDSTFKAAFERNKDAIKQLKEELKKSDAIVKAVTAHAQQPDINDVVGAEFADGNRLIIYIKKG